MTKCIRRRDSLANHTNDTKNQISLQIGGAEYKEMIRDRMGIDEHEQEDVKLNKLRVEQAIEPELWREELEQRNATHGKVERENRSERVVSVGVQKYNKQVRKMDLIDDITPVAVAKAAQTETKSDDKKANNVVRRAVPELIYDDSVDADEFLPTALRKYM